MRYALGGTAPCADDHQANSTERAILEWVHSLGTLLLAAAIAAQPIAVRCDRPISERTHALFSQFGVVLISSKAIEVAEPDSGARRWYRGLTPDARIERPAVLLDRRVILANGESLEAYSIETGTLLWSQKAGWVQHLSASPHLVAHVKRDNRSRILRIDPVTGTALASRITRQSESMLVTPDAIVDVQLPNESDGVGYVVIAYRPSDLEEMWRFRQTGAARFVSYAGVPYFETLSSIFPIDLVTGSRGPKLPPTGAVDSLWGGSTRELETTDDLDGRSRLRRNDIGTGATIWETDLPFEVLNTLLDSDKLYVTGGIGDENDLHYIAILDWRAGTLDTLVGPTPFIFQWGKVRDSIVATTWDDRLACLTP